QNFSGLEHHELQCEFLVEFHFALTGSRPLVSSAGLQWLLVSHQQPISVPTKSFTIRSDLGRVRKSFPLRFSGAPLVAGSSNTSSFHSGGCFSEQDCGLRQLGRD